MDKCEHTNVQSDPRIAFLVQVARAYYLENQTQAEIAQSLGISRSQVSRHLSEARELGIVQVRVITPYERSPELERLVRGRYPHLQDVVVAPAFSSTPEALRTIIGRAAARYIVDVLRPGQRLALGCGRTLRAMVDALQKRDVPNVMVLQAMGNIGHEAHNIDYNEIARKAADALGAHVYYLSAPAILGVGSGSARALVAANTGLEYALSLAHHADVYIVGLGSLESDQLYARAGLIQQAELDDLHQRGAVGDICGRFFDLDGGEQLSSFAERIVGIDLRDLQRGQLAIGIGGGVDKAAPLLGALRGRFINVLISDEQTVRQMLALDETSPDGR